MRSNLCGLLPRTDCDYTGKKEEITLKTIDQFSDEHIIPNIIRMDTEGYEIEIFRGAERTLKNPILKHLFIELHPTLRTHEEMIELLKTLQTAGFEITHVILKDRIDDIVRTDISIYDLIENPKYLEYSLSYNQNNLPSIIGRPIPLIFNKKESLVL